MNFIFHHFKNELRCDRAGIIIFLVSCLLWVVAGSMILSDTSAWIAVTLPKLFFASGAVVLTGLSFFSGFRDSPVREDHFLNTRPLTRESIFAAKSLYVFLLSLVFAIGQIVLSSILSLDHPAVLHTLIVILWGQCALYLGAFIRVNSSHVVWWCISGLTILMSIFLVAWQTHKTAYRFRDIAEAPLLVVVLLALIAAFFVNSLKMEKARWKFSLIIGAGTLAMFALSIRVPERPRMAGVDVFTEALEERSEIKMELTPRSKRRLRITPQFQSYIKGSPWILSIYPHDVVVTNSSGEELDLSKKITEPFTVGYHGYQAEAVYPFMAYLGEEVTDRLIKHRNYSDNRTLNTTGVIVEIPESFASGDEEITISYEPRLRLQYLEKLGSLPYKKGALFQTPQFVMRVEGAEILKSTHNEAQNRKSSYLFHWGARDQKDLHSVFISPNGEYPWMHRISRYSEVEFTGHSIAGSRDFKVRDSRSWDEKYEPYPTGAEVQLFEMKEVGERHFPRVSRKVTPKRLFGLNSAPIAQPSYVLQSTTEALTGVAPKLEGKNVSDYLAEIERYDYAQIRDNEIIRSTLDDLAREKPEELLDYLSTSLSLESVRSYVIKSLTLYGPENIKKQSLKLLEKNSDLLPLVITRGWGGDARSSMEKITERIGWDDQYDVRRASYYYKDNKSLDRLLEGFDKSSSLETYNALFSSERHRHRMMELYGSLEKEFEDKVRRVVRPGELRQDKVVFFLKTGSKKSLKTYAKKILQTHGGGNKIGGEFGWVLNQCVLTEEYTPLGYQQKVIRATFEQIAELPEEQLKYDEERQRYILPLLNN